MKKIKVFGIPFAGGSEYSFFEFKKMCPNELEFIPISLPGRGRRISENRLEDLYHLRDVVYAEIQSSLETPYVIYGHSMGAMLTALVAEKIVIDNAPLPMALFVSGCESPTTKLEKLERHLLPDGEFLDMIFEMGGSPKEMLENKPLMDFYLPILRSDFKAVDLFQYKEIKKLNTDIHVMIGTEDSVSIESADLWKNITHKEVSVYKFSGDHFFIYEHLNEILNIIKRSSIRTS